MSVSGSTELTEVRTGAGRKPDYCANASPCPDLSLILYLRQGEPFKYKYHPQVNNACQSTIGNVSPLRKGKGNVGIRSGKLN